MNTETLPIRTIILASANPVKVRATLHGFGRAYPNDAFHIESIPLPSGVSDQPASDDETRQGAVQRARNAQTARPDADFWIGLEGGIEDSPFGMAAYAWVAILGNQDGQQRLGLARTAAFLLPPAVAELVRQGVELGAADDQVFGRVNSKHHDGAVGLLTKAVIDRASLYEHGVILALAPFLNPQLYPPLPVP